MGDVTQDEEMIYTPENLPSHVAAQDVLLKQQRERIETLEGVVTDLMAAHTNAVSTAAAVASDDDAEVIRKCRVLLATYFHGDAVLASV